MTISERLRDSWPLVTITALLVVVLGFAIWLAANYTTVCPDGYSMIGDTGAAVGVGPNMNGQGGVNVVVVPTDDRTCLRVDGDLIISTDPISVRKP